MAGENFVAGTEKKPSNRITTRDVRARSQPPPSVRSLGRVTFPAIRPGETPSSSHMGTAAIYRILIESDHSTPRELCE